SAPPAPAAKNIKMAPILLPLISCLLATFIEIPFHVPAESSAILAAGSRRVEFVSIGFWHYLFWSAPHYGLLPLDGLLPLGRIAVYRRHLRVLVKLSIHKRCSDFPQQNPDAIGSNPLLDASPAWLVI